MQYAFHELHADGHHAICAVCNGQRWDQEQERYRRKGARPVASEIRCK
jgi:hypothetical protein